MRALDQAVELSQVLRLLEIDLAAAQHHPGFTRLATLANAQPGDLGFLADSRYAKQARDTKAGAVLVRAADKHVLPPSTIALVVADPYLSLAKVSALFDVRLRAQSQSSGIHESAIISTSAVVAGDALIASGVVIGDGARIAQGVRIGANCTVGAGVEIGPRTVLDPGVNIYADCVLGADCRVYSGTVIGSDGFGFAPDNGAWSKISHLGRVVIDDRVEIGANCTIDRGLIDDTHIASDCILDNLIQIAHNVHIGSGCALAACVGVAGSARLGKRCMIGGSAGILGHLELADDVVVSAKSLVTRSLRQAGFYSGSFPIMSNAKWERAAAVLRNLPDLRLRLRHLEKLTKEYFNDRDGYSRNS